MQERKFNGQRLREALLFRGKKMSELSKETGVSRQSLSLYANGVNNPPLKNVEKIAEQLSFPVDYFMTEDFCTTMTGNTYFRSQAAAKKKEQSSQMIKLEYVAKMYEAFTDYVDFPEVDLPDVGAFHEAVPIPSLVPAEDISDEIEALAAHVRKCWHLGNGPIDDMQYLLAEHGIIVTGFQHVDNKIDAFSQKVYIKDSDAIYIIALALGSKPECRLLFDMAHELGHILMHDWDDNAALSREEFSNLERQANMFAGAFLLPKDSFRSSIASYATNIDYYILRKKEWHVSMQAMMYRARQLNMISANQFAYMMRNVSARGWRTWEPKDIIGVLGTTIFQGAVDVLFDGGYLTPEELVEAFHVKGIYLKQQEMEALLGLKEGTLEVNKKVVPFRFRIKSRHS